MKEIESPDYQLIRCKRIPVEFEPGLMADGCVLDMHPELRQAAVTTVLVASDADTQTWRLSNPVDVSGIDGIEDVS